MTRASQGRRATLALALGSLVFCVAVAEFVLRHFVPLDTGSSHQFRIPDPLYGWVLQPAASYVNASADDRPRVTYNARGFRDVERDHAKPAGVFRIVVLGDSYMEGYSLELEDSFHRRLEALARESGRDVEVVNLGVGGYGTLQESLILEHEGWKYDPDLVLLAFYPSNDLRNNSLELETMLSDAKRKRAKLKSSARPFLVPGPAGEWQLTQVDYEASVRRYEKALARQQRRSRRLEARSALVRASKAAIERVEDALEELGDEAASSEREGDELAARRRELAAVGAYYCEEPAEYARAWQITDRIFERMKRAADARGVPLLVFSTPAKHEVDPATRDAMRAEVFDPDAFCLEEARPIQRLAALLRERDIDFVDLLPRFRQAARSDGELLFGVLDAHWSPAGSALAAGVVWEALAERVRLPASGS